MGLFSRKTDKEIIAEGRSLYIKGDLSGANLKLIKLAMKGNDEACYWVGRICLEEAGKRGNAKRREQGKIYLEKGARLGNKDAAVLLKKEFGMPNSYDNKEDEKVKAEAEAKAKAEAEAKAKEEAEAKAKEEAEARAKAEAEAKEEAEAKAKEEAEARARAEAETLARVEEEKEKNAQAKDEFSHLDLCRQYCAEMRSVPGVPIGCERILHVNEIRNIAKSCKDAETLGLKFGNEINSRELELYLNGKYIVQKDIVFAFADHREQGAVLMYKDAYNEHNLLYRSDEGNLKMFTFDSMNTGIHGAYMEDDQLVIWDYNYRNVSFCPGTLGPAIAELLQKLVIAFYGEKDYKRLQKEKKERSECAYQEIQANKKTKEEREKAEAKVKAEAKARANVKYKISEEAMNRAKHEANDPLFMARRFHFDKNYEKAFQWYMKAAEQGNMVAQFYVGTMFRAGKGVEKNLEEALKWFRRATEQGHLGAAEMEARVKAETEAEAKAERTKIKEQNPGELCYYLATEYLELAELSGNVNVYERGMRELEKAANLGHEGAIRRLRKEKEKVNEKALEKADVLEEDSVTLSLDNGEVIKCSVINIFEAANGREYIALLPTEGEGADTGELYLYRYSENDEGEPIFENIDDDAEFEIVSNSFDETILDDFFRLESMMV